MASLSKGSTGWVRLKKTARGFLSTGIGALVFTGVCVSGALADSSVASAAEASDEAPIVTFTGLRVYEDGSSTLFVDLTRSTSVQMEQEGKDVSFLLGGAKVRYRNNKNPLIAKYFKTNVLRAKLVDEAGGVRLVVQLREDVQTDHDMITSPSGARLRVDVPRPSGR